MTLKQAREYMRKNWNTFIDDLIEENLELLLENEGIRAEEIENKYNSIDDLPKDLAITIRKKQEENVINEYDEYAEWVAGNY